MKSPVTLASDNWAGVSRKIATAIAESASGPHPAYGGDEITKRAEQLVSEVFEKDVAVYFVTTCTAANALSIASFAAPGGVVLCHRDAHVAVDEAGAVPFFGGGLTLDTLPGEGGKLDPAAVKAALGRYQEGFYHVGRLVGLTVSQLTEWGKSYEADEIGALSDVARTRGLGVHMDGARFANAVVSTGRSPADLTWRAGVDVLSFGGSKNGCLVAEAVVFFDKEKAHDFGYARQRSGHGVAKNWFIAAQYLAYLDGDHWLELAAAANRAGVAIADALRDAPAASLVVEPDANQIFASISRDAERRLTEAGFSFYEWPAGEEADPDATEITVRLVTSHATTQEETERFRQVLGTG